jgi:hypothetical protein
MAVCIERPKPKIACLHAWACLYLRAWRASVHLLERERCRLACDDLRDREPLVVDALYEDPAKAAIPDIWAQEHRRVHVQSAALHGARHNGADTGNAERLVDDELSRLALALSPQLALGRQVDEEAEEVKALTSDGRCQEDGRERL